MMRNLMLCILLLSTYASAEVRFYGSLGSGIESGRFRWNGQSTTQTAVRDLDSETFGGIKFRSYFDVNTGRITNIHPE